MKPRLPLKWAIPIRNMKKKIPLKILYNIIKDLLVIRDHLIKDLPLIILRGHPLERDLSSKKIKINLNLNPLESLWKIFFRDII